MFDVIEQSTLLIIALGANALSAMAGGGTGLLQLPALIFLGLPFAKALATHKIATIALGAGASLKHYNSKHLRLDFAAMMLAGGLPGVILGAGIVLAIPEILAKLILGLLTLMLGLYSFMRPKFGQIDNQKNHNARGYFVGGLGLFLLGILNGSLSSGTGLFVTAWLVSWFGFDYKRATAYTLVVVGLFWNGTGALTLALLTPPSWSWLPALLLGSAIGGYLGAQLATKHGNALIKRVFEIVTVMVGLSLITHALAA